MKINAKKYLKNIAITALILTASFFVGLLLHEVLAVREHVTTVFVFAVFLISLLTDGYAYGIVSAFLGVLAVNYAFTFPYFAFSYSVPENFVSALIMIVIALMTGALTTRLKEWRQIKIQSEHEIMRANLLRAVSHDLRTPLTTIYGASSAILENYDTINDTQKIRMVTGIREDSQWLIRMVENLLSITRIDSGNVKLIKTPTVPDELIDAVVIKFKKRYPEQQLEIELPEQVVIVPMDPLLIEQVLSNLLENAVQHAKGMTRLVLRVRLIEGKAVFEVEDNGCGIEKDRLDRIFDGYRGGTEQPMDSQPRNAGIGLSVCATIVKAHGGTIEVRSDHKRGTAFSFALDTEEGSYDE
ncbi:MAG: DUF4118 domain-containing protein [Clostridia bacterium]|nr:DUF4118 domain-containing protein [Clostridia bacterium]